MRPLSPANRTAVMGTSNLHRKTASSRTRIPQDYEHSGHVDGRDAERQKGKAIPRKPVPDYEADDRPADGMGRVDDCLAVAPADDRPVERHAYSQDEREQWRIGPPRGDGYRPEQQHTRERREEDVGDGGSLVHEVAPEQLR